MIIVIQVCLLFLTGFILWCEHTPFFANTVKSILTRMFLSTAMIGVCYHVNLLEEYPVWSKFMVMTITLLLSFFTVHFVLKRYNYNKIKFELKLHKSTLKDVYDN